MKQTLRSVLKKKKKTQSQSNWRIVGFSDSPDVHSQLILIALGKGETKSELLRQVVSAFLKKNNAVKLTVSQIKNIRKLKFDEKDSAAYQRLEKFLATKGVTRSHINQVIKKLT